MNDIEHERLFQMYAHGASLEKSMMPFVCV